MSTVYFLGAGASVSSGIPITADLWYAVAAGMGRATVLPRYLRTVHFLDPQAIDASARYWQERYGGRVGASGATEPAWPDGKPDVIEIFSGLDVALQDDVVLAYDRDGRLGPPELEIARDELIVALSTSLSAVGKASAALLTLCRSVKPTDTVITTNWDHLVERQLHLEAGSNPAHYGTDLRVVNYSGHPAPVTDKERAPVLKLHGSFTWLVCPRCTTLYANPEVPIARLHTGGKAPRRADDMCHCGAGLTALIVPPSFVKDYRSRHLANIWSAAQRALALADRWVFIGYSLPNDDIHVRVLLRKALLSRAAQRTYECRPKPDEALVVEVCDRNPATTGRATALTGIPARYLGTLEEWQAGTTRPTA